MTASPSFSGDGLAEGVLRVGGEIAWVSASTLAGPDVIVSGQLQSGAYVARING